MGGFWSTARPMPPIPRLTGTEPTWDECDPEPEPEWELCECACDPLPDPELAGLASCGDPPLLPPLALAPALGMLIGVCPCPCAVPALTFALLLEPELELGPGLGLRTANRDILRSNSPPLALVALLLARARLGALRPMRVQMRVLVIHMLHRVCLLLHLVLMRVPAPARMLRDKLVLLPARAPRSTHHTLAAAAWPSAAVVDGTLAPAGGGTHADAGAAAAGTKTPVALHRRKVRCH
ncbi:hypothetical protein MSAN_01493600 [Mycena sanguinolenta]|uniref:Uncharacterized protein n=1 Tax=Mycena sanguinolenta TaxID=230812 RepID=A0A8H6YAV6_9AGAR|nr:hypothetical protein MSAN_01493600 [Mycena sanguinolenta]